MRKMSTTTKSVLFTFVLFTMISIVLSACESKIKQDAKVETSGDVVNAKLYEAFEVPFSHTTYLEIIDGKKFVVVVKYGEGGVSITPFDSQTEVNKQKEEIYE